MARVRKYVHPLLVMILLLSQVITGWTFTAFVQAEGNDATTSISTASVKVVGNADPATHLDQTDVEITADQDTALDALKKAIGSENVGMSTAYPGMIDSIYGLASQGTYYWAFFVNGESASVGANDYKVQIGDQIEFRYISWSTASVQVVGNADSATHLDQTDVEIIADQDTALDALKEAIGSENVGMSTTYPGMIDSIYGLASEGTYYWAFFVNGESASVGADDYKVQIGDKIEFRYISWSTASVKVVGNADPATHLDQTDVEIIADQDTALDTLKKAIGSENVVMSTTYPGMIDSIYGLASQGTYYWAFYVNGESASVGANDYKVQVGDQIEFRYESWETPADGGESTPTPDPVDQSEPPTSYDQSNLESIKDLIADVSDAILADNVVSEWDAITLAVAGQSVPESFKTQLMESSNDFRQATDLSKRILALRAVGLNPENVNEVNFISELYQRDDATTLLNNTIWTLIALESGNYTVPSNAKFIKEDLVASLISKQNRAGWWKLTGTTGDFDITCMAVTALSLYRDQEGVEESIAKAAQWLSSQQSEDGGFYDAYSDPSLTLSQMIIGLASNGMSPSGALFTKSQGSAISKQLDFYHSDSKKFYSSASSYRLATRQALQALVAYRNYIEGGGFLYQYEGSTFNDSEEQTPGDDQNLPPAESKTITITVKGPDSVLVPKTTFQVEGDATPVSVLKKVVGANQVGVDSEGYVYSIKGIEEFDYGPESGWNYSVNGAFPTESAGYYELHDGDNVKWLYTLDLGKDVGASTGGVDVIDQIPKEIPKEVGEALQKLQEQFNSNSPKDAVVLNPNQKMTKEEADKLRDSLRMNAVSMKKSFDSTKDNTLSEPKGEVQLVVPSNSMTESKELSVDELSMKREEAISSVYEFLPKGSKFKKSIYITIKVPLDQEKPENLVLAWLDEEENVWKALPTVVDAKTGSVTGLVDHFTKFAVVDLPKVSASTPAINVDQAIEKGLVNILKNESPSEWEVFALARAGYPIPKKYRDAIDRLIQDQKGTFRKVTDVERMALTIKAIGGNPTRTSGYNLIDKIYNHEKLTMQGTNGPIFALITLDSGQYEVPSQAKWNRENLLSEILKNQNADGGFVLAEGEASNVDITSMALASLAPYQDRAEVQAAVKKALEWISKVQLKNGGLMLEGQENSESVAQTIIGLTSLGVNPRSTLFTKEAGDLLSNLLRFQNEDGGYSNHFGQPSNPIATEQALMALVAYRNWVNGKESLYQLVSVPQDRYDDEADIAAYALEAVYQAKKEKLMDGISLKPPVFAPKKKLTRAEFTTLLLRLKGEVPLQGASLIFDDVKPGAWYHGFIARAKEKGYVSGVSATQFAPERPITREEMAVMIARAFDLKADETPSDLVDLSKAHPSYLPFIESVYDHGIMVGYEKRFEPQTLVTREMAAAMAMKIYKQ